MYLVFDIGGTNTRLSLANDDGLVGDPVFFPTIGQDFDAGLNQFLSHARPLINNQPLSGIAGGIPGTLQNDHKTINVAPNLPAWSHQPFAHLLEQALSAPTYLANDTAVIGLGEASLGAGSGYPIVAYITVSTGLGGSRFVNQRLDVNALGFEPGHQIVDINGPLCGCGNAGHLESILSGSAFQNKYQQAAKDITDPLIWEQAGRHLAIGLHNVLVFWSPHIVVLGGSLMKKINLDQVTKYLRENTNIFNAIPPIKTAQLGEAAGLLGSLAFLQQQLQSR